MRGVARIHRREARDGLVEPVERHGVFQVDERAARERRMQPGLEFSVIPGQQGALAVSAHHGLPVARRWHGRSRVTAVAVSIPIHCLVLPIPDARS